MPELTSKAPRISDYLAEPLRVGEPDIHGPLAVFPVFGPNPAQPYASFAQAREHGVMIKELDHGASVNDLKVANPTDVPVLLYEGEEVLGAQQNRTFDLTALIGGKSTLRVPVSCVEHGRWQGSRHDEQLKPSPQVAYPKLRRAKSDQVKQNQEAGLKARADQRLVWEEVACRLDETDTPSDTGAMSDIYDHHRDRLGDFVEAIRLRENQSGSLVAIAGRFVVLDWVSRPEVFAALHGPLVRGYALDALNRDKAHAPSHEEAGRLLSWLLTTPASEHDGIGLGRGVRLASDELSGAGLVAGRELVQLSAFQA